MHRNPSLSASAELSAGSRAAVAYSERQQHNHSGQISRRRRKRRGSIAAAGAVIAPGQWINASTIASPSQGCLMRSPFSFASTLLACTLLLAPLAPASATIFKCKAANGAMQFSDRPCGTIENQEEIAHESPSTAPAPTASHKSARPRPRLATPRRATQTPRRPTRLCCPWPTCKAPGRTWTSPRPCVAIGCSAPPPCAWTARAWRCATAYRPPCASSSRGTY